MSATSDPVSMICVIGFYSTTDVLVPIGTFCVCKIPSGTLYVDGNSE